MVDRKMSAENKIMGATTEISPAYIYPSPILKKCCKQNAVTFINSLCCAQKYLLKTSSFIVYYQHCSFRNIFEVGCDCFLLTSGVFCFLMLFNNFIYIILNGF